MFFLMICIGLPLWQYGFWKFSTKNFINLWLNNIHVLILTENTWCKGYQNIWNPRFLFQNGIGNLWWARYSDSMRATAHTLKYTEHIGIFESPKCDVNPQPNTRGIGPLVGRTSRYRRSVMHVLAVFFSITCHFFLILSKYFHWIYMVW